MPSSTLAGVGEMNRWTPFSTAELKSLLLGYECECCTYNEEDEKLELELEAELEARQDPAQA
jgi:hypothetical protein